MLLRRLSKSSWAILRNLLKGHCAYSAMRVLCEILEDNSNRNSTNLLRGAVFFIGNHFVPLFSLDLKVGIHTKIKNKGMSCWGHQRIVNVISSFAGVLPSLVSVVEHQNDVVNREVLTSINRLTKKFGNQVSFHFISSHFISSPSFPVFLFSSSSSPFYLPLSLYNKS